MGLPACCVAGPLSYSGFKEVMVKRNVVAMSFSKLASCRNSPAILFSRVINLLETGYF